MHSFFSLVFGLIGISNPVAADHQDPLFAPNKKNGPTDSDLDQRFSSFLGVDCNVGGRNDPLYPALVALAALRPGKFTFLSCSSMTSEKGKRSLELSLRGSSHDLLIYVLENLAADGYWVELSPLDRDHLHIVVRPTQGLERGIRFVNVRGISIVGDFLPGDDVRRIRRITGIAGEDFFPSNLAARLRTLGYRGTFAPIGNGRISVRLRPGRAIRRIRFHGNLPISTRELEGQLSIDAKPGALARGVCAKISQLRKKASRPPICRPQDVACRQWEANEVQRLNRFLFDQGYLRGTVTLGLVCGRSYDEATLHVYLDKGPAYRIDRKQVNVYDRSKVLNLSQKRQIQRDFVPRILWWFRQPVTRSFITSESEALQANFAERGTNLGGTITSSDRYYPENTVTTSYDQLSRENIPASTNLPLRVNIDLGRPIEARFLSSKKDGSAPLHFTSSQLAAQLQLFRRQESPGHSSALREAGHISTYYRSKGFLLARVRGNYEDFGSLQQLRFEIDEGPQIRIRSLNLATPKGVSSKLAHTLSNRWKNKKRLRRRGYFVESEALSDLSDVLEQLHSEGYLCANVSMRLAFWQKGLDTPGAYTNFNPSEVIRSGATNSWLNNFNQAAISRLMQEDRANLHIRVLVDSGPHFVTDTREEIRYLTHSSDIDSNTEAAPNQQMQPQWGIRRILHDTPLRQKGSDIAGGVSISPELDRTVPAAIAQKYQNGGFPVADAEVTWKLSRSPSNSSKHLINLRELHDPQSTVCQELTTVKQVAVTPQLSIYEGRRGRFGDTLIRGNFKTRSWVLERELRFHPGEIYSNHAISRSVSGIESLGVASQLQVVPYRLGCNTNESGPCEVHHVIEIEEANDVFMKLKFGFGSATLNPLYVFARPSLPNLWGTGWNLESEGRFGFDIVNLTEPIGICDNFSCYERSARLNLTRPHIFGSVINLNFGGQYQLRKTPARGTINSISATTRLSWQIGQNFNFYAGYRFQSANTSQDLIKPVGGSSESWVNRSTATVQDNTGMLESGVVFADIDNAFNPDNGYIAELGLMLASKYLGGWDWWSRMDLSWQHFVPIPRSQDRLNFRYALRFGQIFPIRSQGTDTVPDIWRYYGGGSADLGIRGILPETMLVDIEEISLPFGGRLLRPRAQGGHVRAIGTIALQVVSAKDFIGGKLAHSVFYDFGWLGQFWKNMNLAREFRHSIGINAIKWNINVVTIALGYAVLLGPNKRPTDDQNGRFVFDVGMTF